MPPVGLEPETFAFAAQAITQLTKWAEGFSHILTKILGSPRTSKMHPLLRANRGRGLRKLRAKVLGL